MKKIFLIGDSIRMGYDGYVKMALEGIAEVYYPNENCRFTSYVLRHLHEWKEQSGCGDDVDLVHWNAGLWDALTLLDGKLHISPEVYEENIRRICDVIRILFPKAKMIFATSTPVQEALFADVPVKRYNKDTEYYNALACKIVKEYGGEINDLYSLMCTVPLSYYSDRTHFYTGNGTRVITNQVLSCIEKSLNIQASSLDYEALFSDDTEVVGM